MLVLNNYCYTAKLICQILLECLRLGYPRALRNFIMTYFMLMKVVSHNTYRRPKYIFFKSHSLLHKFSFIIQAIDTLGNP